MDRLNPRTYLDLDGTLAANSDDRVPTQKAVKTYCDNHTLHALAVLTYGNINANQTAEQTVNIPGATVSSTVTLGAPSTINAGLVWCGYVSAADTVAVRLHNTSGSGIDPVDAAWHVQVEVH